MFMLLARVASMALKYDNNTDYQPTVLFCPDIKPRKESVICFEKIVQVPPKADRRASLKRFMSRIIAVKSANPVREVLGSPLTLPPGSKFQLQARALLGLSNIPNNRPDIRKVTVLTRRNGPTWINVPEVLRRIRVILNEANMKQRSLVATREEKHTAIIKYILVHGGFAEDLGRAHSSSCAVALQQVSTWSESWLVITPHGAHESNVVFMTPFASSGGLIEAFACGHKSDTFRVLATSAGVNYTSAHEMSFKDRLNCDRDQGRRYLDQPRRVRPNDGLFTALRIKLRE
jgi:hypothetical protein